MPAKPPSRHRPHERRPAPDEPVLIYGIHAIEAALRNPERVIHRVFLTDNAARRLEAAIASRGAAVESVTPRDLDRRLGAEAVHQGALIEAEPLANAALESLVARYGQGPILALDQVTDPHNVGAVLRSAAVFGAAGLVMTWRNSPPLAGALAKSASGALDHVPVALVPNLSRALAELGELAAVRIGLDGDADALLERERLPDDRGLVLVLGAEGKGLRQLTRQSCDKLCRLATDGPLSSLNVSNAAAVALHLCLLRRHADLAPPGA